VLVGWVSLSQTSATMKTLSGKFKVMALAATGGLMVLSLHAFAQRPCPPESTFVLKITKHATLQDQDGFKAVLKSLGTQNYCIKVQHNNGKPDEEINSDSKAQLDLKTDNVIVSEMATSVGAGVLTPIQAHATIQISSLSKDDLIKVLKAFN